MGNLGRNVGLGSAAQPRQKQAEDSGNGCGSKAHGPYSRFHLGNASTSQAVAWISGGLQRSREPSHSDTPPETLTALAKVVSPYA